jgi:4-amino-4-deoxy-L-arabinose transferase-like glycosyltransferase
MELRHVEPVRVAGALSARWPHALLAAVVVLTLLRFAAGAVLPLSADEAYYWLWSRHLAAGYYDHPPLIAFAIRAGTALFGNTAFAIRCAGLALSVAASWAVWQTAKLTLPERPAAAWACLFFNLTLMVAVEAMAATPDAPVIAAAAFFLYFLARVEAGHGGQWWLAAGIAAGIGLLSKYTALFFGAGALVWLLADPRGRRWLLSPWPYAGGLIALLIFLPNLLWNARHDWMTFAFQFGRVDRGPFTLRFLGEFVAAQFGMATPFIFILALFGLFVRDGRSRLAAAMIWPAAAYFLFHALHDRVQGNWPSFLFPALALCAADAMFRIYPTGWRARLVEFSRKAAVPVAALMLGLVYLQAVTGILPLGRKDPLQRLLAFGFAQTANDIVAVAQKHHAVALLTTEYKTTAWLRYYLLKENVAVVPVDEPWRWLMTPSASKALLSQPLLYVANVRQDGVATVAQMFDTVRDCGTVTRSRGNQPIDRYRLYCVSGAKPGVQGRIP